MPKLILSVAYRGILDSPLVCEESRQIEKRIRADYHDITEWAASQGWTAKVEANFATEPSVIPLIWTIPSYPIFQSASARCESSKPTT